MYRFERYLANPATANVVLTVEKFRHIAEISLSADGFMINAHEETSDMYSAIDMALDKLDKQIKKNKEKYKKSRSTAARRKTFPYQQTDAAGSEDVESAGANPYVTCGSVIKLRASQLGTRITCQEVAYGGGGSGQSAVTGTGSSPNAFSYWQVRGAVGEDCMQGARLAKGSRIRLQSVSRKQWLHSHHIRSMLSNHQEVSCFGSETESDDSDNGILPSREQVSSSTQTHSS